MQVGPNFDTPVLISEPAMHDSTPTTSDITQQATLFGSQGCEVASRSEFGMD